MHRDQSVAEHSFRVVLIARHLTLLTRPYLIRMVTESALLHDLDEVITGDVPGPAKSDQWPEKNVVESIVKVADAIETGTYWVQWGNPAAWTGHPYNVAPQRDIEKIMHYAANVPGLLDVAIEVWRSITGRDMVREYGVRAHFGR
jgi:HD superfamily phosphodiesterase